MARSRNVRAAFGFSLVELLIVVALSSVMLLSLSAALSGTLATTADVSDELQAWHAVSAALLKMESELAAATDVITTEQRRVRFYVPDITGDGAPDLVDYDWDGTAGSPLTRSVNSAAPVELLTAVQNVSFSYNYVRRTPATIAPGEEDLAVTPGYFEQDSGYSYATYLLSIRDGSWRAQRFTALTDTDRTDAVSFFMENRFEIFFSSSSLRVELWDLEADRQIAWGIVGRSVLCSLVSRGEATAVMSWHHPEGSGLVAGKDYRWVFKPTSGGYAGSLLVYAVTSGAGHDDGTMYEYSTDRGESWRNYGNVADAPFSTLATRAIEYGITAEQMQWCLRRVSIHLEYGTGRNAVEINTAVRLANTD